MSKVIASGGTETTITVGGVSYKVHTFTSDGTFTVTQGGSVEYFIVGGGGGAGHVGSAGGSGGGGGGGIAEGDAEVTADNYAVTVGAGGAGAVADGDPGNTGIGSSVASIGSVDGGGGSGGASSGAGDEAPDDGANGGGGGSGFHQDFGAAQAANGNDGGQSWRGADEGGLNAGGGGGSVVEAGGNADSANGGDGSDGYETEFFGATERYGAGGGGGIASGGTAGAAGQGGVAGNIGAGLDASANTGAGGGGAGGDGAGRDGGDGGSGIVGIRYPELGPVENVQATSLGSDSIEVTWDQFENDESPPVAADGYEIEIDSGTPIDVGDVQTYTDDELSAETTRSYRVRAYYTGSPTEYTEWSEAVQATTDAETLTTIPRSFVITADIKLRDEAPEVSEPPVAVTREYWVIAYRNVAASGFKTWRVFGGELLNGQTFSAPSSQVLGAHLSPDGNWLAYGQTSDPHLVIRSHSEGTLGSNVSVADRPDDTVRAVRFSYSGNFVAVAHGQSGSSEFASTNLSVYEHSNGTLTYIDSIQLGSNAGLRVAWNEDGDRLIFTESTSWDVYLVGFDGAALTNLDSSVLGRGSNSLNQKTDVAFLAGTHAVVARNNNLFELVDVSGDTFSVEQDSIVGENGPVFSPPYLAIGDAAGTSGERAVYVYKFDGSSLTLADEAQPGVSATRAVSISQDAGLVAHVDASNVDILSLVDDELTILDTEAWASTIQGVIIYPGWTP